MSEIYDWQVAVFCQNEEGRIAACIESVDIAIGRQRGLITVLLNGSTDGSKAAITEAAAKTQSRVELVEIELGDKANAINRFFYEFRADAAMFFCVDGYATIDPNALSSLNFALWRDGVAHAASGRSVNGRTEAALSRSTLAEGGVIRGQLYALRPSYVERIVNAGIRLPIGLYRGDSLLGSMTVHDLDAVNCEPVNRRVLGVENATYAIDSLSVGSFSDLRRQFHRVVRQMRGKLENAAIKQIVHTQGYKALPLYADDMIADYLASNPVPAVRLIDRPFMVQALLQCRRRLAEKKGCSKPLDQTYRDHVLATRPLKHHSYAQHR